MKSTVAILLSLSLFFVFGCASPQPEEQVPIAEVIDPSEVDIPVDQTIAPVTEAASPNTAGVSDFKSAPVKPKATVKKKVVKETKKTIKKLAKKSAKKPTSKTATKKTVKKTTKKKTKKTM